jgi:hypothetical protein
MFYGWDNFFLMVGPSAASLIGLLFVVVTLTAGRERSSALRGAALYLTPTVFHFGVVLAVAAVAMAPGLTVGETGLLIAALAVFGLGYTAQIGWRLYRADDGAKPHWSDFWTYGAAPPVIYLFLLAADALVFWRADLAAYGVAVTLLILLFTGIRNAWDLVTWMAPGAATVDAALPPATAPTPPKRKARAKRK